MASILYDDCMSHDDGIQAITPEQRLVRVEQKVDQILASLAGGLGHPTGLVARVERLESWGKWLAGMASAAILAAVTSLVKGQH